jgi:hypothetical protein
MLAFTMQFSKYGREDHYQPIRAFLVHSEVRLASVPSGPNSVPSLLSRYLLSTPLRAVLAFAFLQAN